MKKIIKAVIAAGFIVCIFMIFKNAYSENNINLKNDKLYGAIKYKGIKNAVDFTADNQGNFYIAYKDRIQFVDSKGKSYDVVKSKDLNIKSLDYKDEKLYFISDSKVSAYDIVSKEQKVLLSNLPNYGDYKDSIIRVKGEELYISIGAATNSGVVGSDNSWLKDNPFSYDIPAKDIVIRGKSFGNEKTGAFVPYRTKNASGQLISGHFPGNASIIYYNIVNGGSDTYAWGIRNVNGMSFNSEGTLIATIGGIEDRGLRAVKGDVDYIYEIKKNHWYGWPDYSGGDPVTSPRFKGENNIRLSFILDNHPTTNPLAPIYTHKSLSSLGALDIDAKGVLSERDSIYFYDTRDNRIYSITKAGVLSDEASFSAETRISSLRFVSNNLFALDYSQGILYSISKNRLGEFAKLNKPVIYYLLAVILIGIVIGIFKFNASKEK
ncbi:hypothetical protein NBE98_08740 [Clostridium swellfunianum]|uniref:hypothetical protein n=1 Tax=Clostridium swellfunianum TaxID=1367462 RepID=UPI00202E7D7B|nr:hypothetical protein [Clostridium swellfunianum]MCM0648460.1 hypothetical protein [Clostridium swellfunianum]